MTRRWPTPAPRALKDRGRQQGRDAEKLNAAIAHADAEIGARAAESEKAHRRDPRLGG